MPTTWYFDFISPFAFLQWQRLKTLDSGDFEFRPLLFAGLLNHLDHKGPAEFPDKRLFSYRHVQWRAERAGIAFRFPPAHPFKSLPALRLCVAAGCTRETIDTIFDHIWRDGLGISSAEEIQGLGGRLDIRDVAVALEEPGPKAALQDNFNRALADGVFGVPSLVVDGQVFWGDDATDMYLDYLRNPAMFDAPEMRRLASLPVGATRKPSSGHGIQAF